MLGTGFLDRRRTPLGTLAGGWYWLAYWLPCVAAGMLARVFASRRRAGDPQVVAVLAPEHIGDLVFTTPLLRALRQRFPRSRLIVAATHPAADAVETCPFVDEIVRWGEPNLRAALRVGLALRRRRTELVIVPRADPSGAAAALAAVASGAPRRIGLTDQARRTARWKRLQGAPFLTEVVRVPDSAVHEQQRRLAIAEHLGSRHPDPRAATWTTASDDRAAATFLATMPPECWRVAFGIGASAANRRWPVDRYAGLIGRLATLGPIAPVIIAGPEDAEDVRRLRDACPLPVYATLGMTLRESIAVLRRCAVFVGNDSGPAHLAAAGGLPTFVISAHPHGAEDVRHPSHPAKCGPGSPDACVLRPPAPLAATCGGGCLSPEAHCIRAIGVATVFAAIARTRPGSLPGGTATAGWSEARTADCPR